MWACIGRPVMCAFLGRKPHKTSGATPIRLSHCHGPNFDKSRHKVGGLYVCTYVGSTCPRSRAAKKTKKPKEDIEKRKGGPHLVRARGSSPVFLICRHRCTRCNHDVLRRQPKPTTHAVRPSSERQKRRLFYPSSGRAQPCLDSLRGYFVILSHITEPLILFNSPGTWSAS